MEEFFFSSDFIRSINPSLPDHPPPCEEQSGKDLCLLPSPSDPFSSPILCQDLEEGKRCVVGSWFVSPDRHFFEWLVITLACLLFVLWPLVSKGQKRKKGGKKRGEGRLQPPWWLKVLSGVSTIICCFYKYVGFPGKILFMTMPCNTLWLVFCFLSFGGVSDSITHTAIQMSYGYMVLVIIALAAPDLGDLVLPFEVEWFFLQHWLLFLYPGYYLLTGKVSTLPSSSTISHFFTYWALACVYFSLYYASVVTPLALFSGLNLNYLLSPPPLPGDIDLKDLGPDYRLYCAISMFTLFFVTRLLVLVAEWVVRRVMGWVGKRKKE